MSKNVLLGIYSYLPLPGRRIHSHFLKQLQCARCCSKMWGRAVRRSTNPPLGSFRCSGRDRQYINKRIQRLSVICNGKKIKQGEGTESNGRQNEL